MVGARLVLADPDPETYNLSPATVDRMLLQDPTISVVMPVHLYGQPVDIAEICAVAKKHGARVVEDACQAHGARLVGKRAGSFGDAAAFSFYPGKNLGAYGDGGGRDDEFRRGRNKRYARCATTARARNTTTTQKEATIGSTRYRLRYCL